MKYVFVGDIHGKWEAVEEALAKDGLKIFMGDIIDSYDRTYKDHEKCYDLVFAAIENGNAQCLYGNHELSYLVPQIHRCSGYSRDYQRLIDSVQSSINKLFIYWMYNPDVNLLATHAGITNPLLQLSYENLEQNYVLAKIEDWLIDNIGADRDNPCHWIGQDRGGRHNYGGIFWGDWLYHIPIPGLLQVMGHTRGNGIRQKGKDLEETGISYCIDCLDETPYQFLTIEL